MKRLLEYETVKQFFKDNDCVLLERNYKNNRSKMKFICKCGNIYSRNFDSFEKFPHCRKCGYQQAAKSNSFTQQEVSQLFTAQGCQLLGDYKNCRIPMLYRCSCGDIASVSLDNFKRGRRCKKCGRRKISGEGHGRWIADREKVRLAKLFRKKCYKALSSVFKAFEQKKKSKTVEILGYSPSELQDYITRHPNWVVVKDYNWHLDHVFPIQAFLDYGITDIKTINSLENLQPLLAKHNLSKSDDYCKEEFERWLKKHGVVYYKDSVRH